MEYLEGNRRKVIHADREVILSAGAVNSPQLLMLSGVGPERLLTDREINVVLNQPKTLASIYRIICRWIFSIEVRFLPSTISYIRYGAKHGRGYAIY